MAVWLEGSALLAILILDSLERRDRRREQQEQRADTANQLATASEAARATTRSTEILSSLHRPFVGLVNMALPGAGRQRLWNVVFYLKNYGTLPAANVHLIVEWFTDGASRGRKADPSAVEIFPSNELSMELQFDLGDQDWPGVSDGTKKLRFNIIVPYEAGDGRRFTHTARVLYQNGRFEITVSETANDS